MLLNTICIVLAAFLLRFISTLIYQSFFNPLSEIPNVHFSAPFSRLWLLITEWSGSENRSRYVAHQQHGPIIRTGPREIDISSISVVKTVFNSFERSDWYRKAFLLEDIPYMLVMPNDAALSRRKLMASLFSKTAVQGSKNVQLVLEEVVGRRLLPKLFQASKDHLCVNALWESRKFAMDATSTWVFGMGRGTDFLREEEKARLYFKHYIETGYVAFWRTEFPQLSSWLRKSGIYNAPLVAENARRCAVAWTRQLCDRANFSSDSDAVSKEPTLYQQVRNGLMAAESANPVLDTALSIEMLDQLGAGHEPMGTVLAYAFLELSKHPRLQSFLRREVRDAQADSGRVVSSPDNDGVHFLTARQLAALPWLNSVLTETLRLYSPNPGPQKRVVPPSRFELSLDITASDTGFFTLETKIDGRGDDSNERIKRAKDKKKGPERKKKRHIVLPEGTVITATSYCLHRNPRIFPQPDEWRPERWMEADEEQRREMQRWMWPFSSGARMCTGEHLATTILMSVLAAVYAEFESSIVGSTDDMKQLDHFVACPAGEELNLLFKKV